MLGFFGSEGSSGSGATIGHLESSDVNLSYRYDNASWPDSKVVFYGQSMGVHQ